MPDLLQRGDGSKMIKLSPEDAAALRALRDCEVIKARRTHAGFHSLWGKRLVLFWPAAEYTHCHWYATAAGKRAFARLPELNTV